MQTAQLSSSGIPSFNYGMAVLEKKYYQIQKFLLLLLINKHFLTLMIKNIVLIPITTIEFLDLKLNFKVKIQNGRLNGFIINH